MRAGRVGLLIRRACTPCSAMSHRYCPVLHPARLNERRQSKANRVSFRFNLATLTICRD
ncbi:hypothetical protein RB2952 [Rhodopirellula baltica SH 1]|uniref:Uncharacterized protein n=1 Tax=Rhodopirellula baltica (strain DSM 10527 / NCIMB 13988 / SH1) TaxID=243090 RepID=Q7UV06_RHOBA|nr:hypothetical protein RB2952 [Rhodopirellula baltica SH 1]